MIFFNEVPYGLVPSPSDPPPPLLQLLLLYLQFFLSEEERLTSVQAELAARNGESSFYVSKIKQLEEKCCEYQFNEKHFNQFKSEHNHVKEQFFEERITFERTIRDLEIELKRYKCIQFNSKIKEPELPNIVSNASKSPRSSCLTYISMKDKEFPHYESIHSSMLQVIEFMTSCTVMPNYLQLIILQFIVRV